MAECVRLGLAQINCTVGDLAGNAEKIISYVRQGIAEGVDIISFPEMAVTGYPPEDLLLKSRFVEENISTLGRIARECRGIVAVIGFAAYGDPASREVEDDFDKRVYNAAALIQDGDVRMVYHKMLLPNYGVFDERRYFTAGREPALFELGGVRFGVNICEDMWHKMGTSDTNPIADEAELIINLNASPFHAGKQRERVGILRERISESGAAVAYTNLVGGQDELVFDGGSMLIDSCGEIVAAASRFEETLLVADLEVAKKSGKETRTKCILLEGDLKGRVPLVRPEIAETLAGLDEIYAALVLGTRDYVIKSGFKKVIIGLSGGIDSALTAAVAADALGASNVLGVAMPSRYSSQGSIDDAKRLAGNLKIGFETIPIEEAFGAFKSTLAPLFVNHTEDVTEENLQARIRGNILMALSNKFGSMVLTTGNKSEMAVGYSTLYGDMAGGFSVLKDVPKTRVYELSRYRNDKAGYDIIPSSSITKAPSAELRPDQTDQDSLPPYDLLDNILQKYVEEGLSAGEIAALGFDLATVDRVAGMVDRNEYKRRQAAPGVKITPRAFGRDRRMPIVNRYRGGAYKG